MASSIGGASGIAPTQGPGDNGDDKKTEKKATVRLSDGDHTIGQTSSASQSQSTGSRVGDLKKKLEEAKGASFQKKTSPISNREMTNIPPGTVKHMAGVIEAKVKELKSKTAQDEPIQEASESSRGELSLVGHIVRDGRAVQRMMKDAQPLSASASSSVKERARKAWQTIKQKLAAILASLQSLLGMIKGRASKGGLYDGETVDIDKVITQLNEEFMGLQDLSDYVDMDTGDVTRQIPEGLSERVERLQGNIWAYNRMMSGRHEQE